VPWPRVQLERLRKDRDDQAANAARLEEENKRLKKAAEANSEEANDLQENLDRLREQIESATEAKSAMELRLVKETEARSSLQQELDRLKRKNAELQQQYSEEHDASEEALQRAADAEGRLKGLEEDLDAERSRAEREIGRLRDEVASLTSKVTQVEDHTRKEFVKQLEEVRRAPPSCAARPFCVGCAC
jgi:predicted  nucleic acid-binding Zn-ribbon protein